MAIVVRTMYSNQQWKAACVNPKADEYCAPCFNPNVKIQPPSIREDGICKGQCWDQQIATDPYRWGCTPIGSKWGKRSDEGIPVFFVFRNSKTSLYTLWGRTTVKKVDEVLGVGNSYYFMYFNKFEALARDKWIWGLKDYEIVGNKWLQGRHRYIDSAHEEYLNKCIEGAKPSEMASLNQITTPSFAINIKIPPTINQKLEKIATEEGREKNDIVRQAIAEWLRSKDK